jgi:glycosyltransferase involved in cell wall biosynthesis
MRTPRSVTLVDSMVAGHHVDYASKLCAGLNKMGLSSYVIGRREFIDGVASHTRITDAEVLEYRHGKGLGAELRKRIFLKEAAAAARSFGTDLVHLLFLDRFIFALAAQYPRFQKTPIIGTLHWLYFSRSFPQSISNRLVRPTERRALRGLNIRDLRIQVHSEAAAQVLRREICFPAVDVVPYPAEPLSPSLQSRELRRQIGIPRESVVLLAFGATRRDKGADLAVSALRYLPDDVHLVVAGRPLDFSAEYLLNLARRDRTSHRLHLAPRFIEDHEVINWYSIADLLVLPYRRTFSGQSGPLTQAAALGLPVVCADLTVMTETVVKYRLGYVFPTEDIEKLAEAVLRLRAYPPKPLKASFVRDHSVDAFAGAVCDSYVQALETG